jgi:hypothetical protein
MNGSSIIEKDKKWTLALNASKTLFIFNLLFSLPYLWKLETVPAMTLFPGHSLVWSVKFDLLVPEILLGLVGAIIWREQKARRVSKRIAETVLGSISIVLLIIYPLLADTLPKH